jgi:nucleoside-diphosphate-sugar epimerase
MRLATPGAVLVTGGTGFIGSYVAQRLLALGHSVTVTDLQAPGPEARFVLGEHLAALRCELIPVQDEAGMAALIGELAPRAIVHIAAIVDPVKLLSRPRDALAVNVDATVALLDAAAALDREPRFLLFSSAGVLPATRYEPVDVDHPVLLATEGAGTGAYGASKIASEAFAFAYHRGCGLDIRIIRPSAVYGFGMRFPLKLRPLVEAAVDGREEHLPFGGAMRRDYTHVEDIADLAIAVLGGPEEADRIFYGATGEPLVSPSEIAAAIRELVPGAAVSVGREPDPGEAWDRGERGRLSIENARRQLGFEPRYTKVRDGLMRYLEMQRAFRAETR